MKTLAIVLAISSYIFIMSHEILATPLMYQDFTMKNAS